MSEEKNPGSAGENGSVVSDNSGHTGDDGDRLINPKDHERAVKDALKFKDQAKSMEAKYREALGKLEQIESESLKAREDWKTLYEAEKQKYMTKEQEVSKLKSSVINNERYRSVIGPLKDAGLRDDALGLLDMVSLDDIEIEATSGGRFLANSDSVGTFVDMMKAKHPYAFADKKMPKFNAGGATGKSDGDGPLTPARLFQIEQECRKKGDMAPYYAAVKSWNQRKP